MTPPWPTMPSRAPWRSRSCTGVAVFTCLRHHDEQGGQDEGAGRCKAKIDTRRRVSSAPVSWLEFASQVINALGWPAAAVAAALILRRPLATLVADPALKSLKAGPFEAAWDRALAAVERSTADVVNAPETESSGEQSDPSTPIRVIRRNYERIIQELRKAVQSTKPAIAHLPNDANILAAIARQNGMISEESERSVNTISALYDLAQLSSERLTDTEAIEFRTYSRVLLAAIAQNIKNRTKA